MSTRQAADRRIRAAALGAPGLDIRGPVSQALARAGVTVPPAEADETLAPPETPPPARRAPSQAAPRVLKPFDEAPWPTRATAEPKAVLSGLTADERRVHRILLDTLALQSHVHGTGAGLTYAETHKLAVLDLAFIDAEIDKMDRRVSWSATSLKLVAGVAGATLGVTAGVLGLLGEGQAALVVSGLVVGALILLLPLVRLASASRPASSPRRTIYQALRELALLVDDAPVSNALRQADALIDRLADADAGPHLDGAHSARRPAARGRS